MNKVPMIIYKQDRRDTLVITNYNMFTTNIPSITIFKDNKEKILYTDTYSIYKLKEVLKDYKANWFAS